MHNQVEQAAKTAALQGRRDMKISEASRDAMAATEHLHIATQLAAKTDKLPIKVE